MCSLAKLLVLLGLMLVLAQHCLKVDVNLDLLTGRCDNRKLPQHLFPMSHGRLVCSARGMGSNPTAAVSSFAITLTIRVRGPEIGSSCCSGE